MNKDTLQGQWKQLTGAAKAKWSELTEDDLKAVEGNVEMLVGKVQERYGIARDEAKKQVEAFKKSL